jgi:hypothetical protein
MNAKADARLSILLWGILFLFFAQLLTDFFEAIYAFGLLGTSLPVEMVSLFLLFSPLVLLLFQRGLPGWTIVLLGYGVLACRAGGRFASMSRTWATVARSQSKRPSWKR